MTQPARYQPSCSSLQCSPLCLCAGVSDLEAGVDRFGLERQYGEDALVDAPQRFSAGGAVEGLQAEGVLAERQRAFVAEIAVADEGDAWAAFAAFMQRILDSDVLAITINLAGTFTPTDDLMADSVRAEDLNTRLIRRTKAEGGLRADVEVDDLSLILEQVASLRLGDERRTRQLRRRYLALFLAGLRAGGEPLPGPAPAPMELASRWSPRDLR